ncbi:MAG: hypothetical protein KJ890_15480 [Gammaproteobacteria bacterium]|nr:hypothetical protein [Gammaproteobacteria bacterium]MBU0801657.1 hypothetical protein [Alphaproteobacteria bacterium]MBU1803830.1 hypothetical protein [Gammaproteobacteria bacterium]
MPMTNEEYLADAGNHCPFCRSPNIQGGGIEVEAGRAWQNINCDNCGKGWQDEYELTGWTDEFSDNED